MLINAYPPYSIILFVSLLVYESKLFAFTFILILGKLLNAVSILSFLY